MRAITVFAALCVLIGCVSAQSETYGWKVGKQYIYRVEGRLMSGISKINTQYAGLHLKYKMILTVVGPNRLNLNPVEFKAVEVNDELEGGWRDGVLKGEQEAHIPQNLLEFLESPVEVEHESGVVKNIRVQGDLPMWAINIKRAQVSVLNLDTTGVNAVLNGNLNRQIDNSVRKDELSGFFYETMEETIHGECEAYYTVAQNGPEQPPYHLQSAAKPKTPSQVKSSSESDEDRSYEKKKPSLSYRYYKKLTRSQNSDSHEDSTENMNELPWPRFFDHFCENGNQVYEIIKTINFTTCQQKPVLAYVTPSELYCRPGDNTCGNLWNRFALTRYLACGTSRQHFTVLKIETEEQIHFGLRETQKTLVGTVQNFTLIEVKEGGQPEQVKNPKVIESLVFEFSPKEQLARREGKLSKSWFFGRRAESKESSEENNSQQWKSRNQRKHRDSQEDSSRSTRRQQKRWGKHSSEDRTSRKYGSQESQERKNIFKQSRSNRDSQEDSSRSTERQQKRWGKHSSEERTSRKYGSQESQEHKNIFKQSRRNRGSASSEETQTRRSRYNSAEMQQQPWQMAGRSSESEEDVQNLKAQVARSESKPAFDQQPTLKEAPLNPFLISPLKKDGMIQRVQELMKEIVKDITSKDTDLAESETLSKISTVAKILRRLDYDDIYRLYNNIAAQKKNDEDQTARNIFIDTIAIAGTNPNHMVLFELLKKGQLGGERAAQVIMTLPLYVRTPTVQYLKKYFELIQDPQVKKHTQARTTAILSFSTILYQACINARTKMSRFPVALYGEFCDEKIVEQEFLPFFLQKLQSFLDSEKEGQTHFTIVYLKALGNMGHPRVIPMVQKILDNSVDSYVKTNAIFALKHLIISRDVLNVPKEEITGIDRDTQDLLTDELIEKKVLPILVSVALDKGEHPEVRMAAINLLLFTTAADVTIWQQLAYSTWFESSQEVHSFIYSSLKSLSNEKRPVAGVHWRMQKNARYVVALAKPIAPGVVKSRNMFRADFVDEISTGYATHFAYFGSKDSRIPNDIYFRNFYQFGNGGIGVNPLEFNVHGHTIHKIITHVLDTVSKRRPIEFPSHPDLAYIRKELGIESREQEEPIQGNVYFKIRNEMERFFSVNEETIGKILTQLKSKAFNKLRSSEGLPINYQKVFHFAEHTMSMPTALGLPVVYNFRMPLMVSVRGTIKINSQKSNGDMQIQADLHPVYAWKTHGKLAVKVPFTGKQYQAGVQRHLVIETPMRILATKTERGLLTVAVTPAHFDQGHPSGKIDIVTYHQKPYTIIITDELYPVIHPKGGKMNIINAVEKPLERQRSFGLKKLGLKFILKEDSEYRIENEGPSGWTRFFQRFHSPTCWFNVGWVGAPTIRHVERKLVLDLDQSPTNTLFFVVGKQGQNQARLRQETRDSIEDSKQSSSSSSSSSTSESSESDEKQTGGLFSSNKRDKIPRRLSKHSSQEAQEHPSRGRIVVLAVLGKKNAILSAEKQKGVQDLLQTPSTVQYYLQVTKVPSKVFIRVAAGDAANEAAAQLPSSLSEFAKAIIKPSNMKEQQDACVNFIGHYDAPEKFNRHVLVVLRKTLLSGDLRVKVDGELEFGRSCKSMPHSIRFDGQLKRGPKMTMWAKEKSPEAKRCKKDEEKGFDVSPICIRVAEHQAAALNQVELNIEHTKLPIVAKNVTGMVVDFVKAYLYPYMSHDRYAHQASLSQGKIKIDGYMTPNKEYVTLNIIRPNNILKFENVKTGRFVRSIMPLTLTQSLLNNIRDRTLKSMSEPMCTLQGQYVSTYDNVTYKFRPEVAQGCVHLLTKDCTGRRPTAVLVRNMASKQKSVIVILPGEVKIVVTPKGGRDYQVEVNGQHVSLPHFLEIEAGQRRLKSARSSEEFSGKGYVTRIEKMPNGGVQIIEKKLRVATDGDKVIVFASNEFRNRTCGLCGDFNGEKVADMRSPKNCPLSSGTLFAASYALQGPTKKQNCQIDQTIQKKIKQEEKLCLDDNARYQRNHRYEPRKNILSRYQQESDSSESTKECEQKMQLVKQDPKSRNRLCFSTKKMNLCRESSECRPTGEKKTSMEFKCLPRGQEAQRLENLVNQGQFVNVEDEARQQKLETRWISVPVPRSCEKV